MGEETPMMVSVTGLADPVESYEEHVQAWHHLSGVQDDLNWQRGAVLASLVVRYGDATLERFAADVGRSRRALSRYRQVFLDYGEVGERWPHAGLRWMHFVVAMGLEGGARERALELATKGDGDGKPWPVSRLRAHVRAETRREHPLPDGVYRVVYADPPWEYSQEQHSEEEQERVLASHYDVMPAEEIAALDVRSMTAPHAALFLWATSPLLPEALEVMAAWGFRYKASMVWDKVGHNVGHYVSVRHELLLLGTRGSCLPDRPTLRDSVVTEERTEHSRKPKVFRDVIEAMYDGPRVELFAREVAEGWTSHGNSLTTASTTRAATGGSTSAPAGVGSSSSPPPAA